MPKWIASDLKWFEAAFESKVSILLYRFSKSDLGLIRFFLIQDLSPIDGDRCLIGIAYRIKYNSRLKRPSAIDAQGIVLM